MKYVIIPAYGIACFLFGIFIGSLIADGDSAQQTNIACELTQGQAEWIDCHETNGEK